MEHNISKLSCKILSKFLSIIEFVNMLTFSFFSLSKGKLNRGLSVIDSYLLLKQGSEVTEDEFFLACVLGWCVEWVMPLMTLIIPNTFILFREGVA